MNEINTTPENLPATTSDPASLLAVITRLATDPAIDLTRLDKIMDLRDRIVAEEARRAYIAAFSAMQSELPIVGERGKVQGRYTYALWEDINEQIKPVLSKHGFTLEFKISQEERAVVLTAFVRHIGGHQETTSMTLPMDSSGNKNPVQAIASSASYGKRQTAAALLNLTSRGEDDDARAMSNERRPVAAPVEIAKPEPVTPPEADPVTGEVGPREILVPMVGDVPNWIGYGQAFIAAIKSAEDVSRAEEWLRLNSGPIARMEREAPRVCKRMITAYINSVTAKRGADLGQEAPAEEEAYSGK